MVPIETRRTPRGAQQNGSSTHLWDKYLPQPLSGGTHWWYFLVVPIGGTHWWHTLVVPLVAPTSWSPLPPCGQAYVC